MIKAMVSSSIKSFALASDSSRPSELSSGEQIIGFLSEIHRYIPGFIIAKLNDESILVPAAQGRKLKSLIGKVICVTQIDERYSVLEVVT